MSIPNKPRHVLHHVLVGETDVDPSNILKEVSPLFLKGGESKPIGCPSYRCWGDNADELMKGLIRSAVVIVVMMVNTPEDRFDSEIARLLRKFGASDNS